MSGMKGIEAKYDIRKQRLMLWRNTENRPLIDGSSLLFFLSSAVIFDHFLDLALKANHINEEDNEL